MARRNELVQDASILTSTVVISSGLSGVVALLTARLLAPELFGVWQTIRVVAQYVNYANLGLPWAMQQEVAGVERVEGSGAGQPSIEVAVTAVSVLTTGVGLVLVGVAAVTGVPVGWDLMLPTVIWLLLAQVYGLATMVLMARRRFWLAGRADILTSLANLVLTAALVPTLGLMGVVLAQIGWCLAGLLLVWRRAGLRARLRADLAAALRQARVGVQFTANGALFYTHKSIDRLLILAMLGQTALGYYGIALLASGYVELLASAVARSMAPRMIGDYSERQSLLDIRGYVTSSATLLGALVPVLTGAAALAVVPFVHFVLPRYAPGVAAAQVLLVGSAFLAVRYCVEWFFVTVGKLYRTYPIQLAAGLVALVQAYVALRLGLGLEWVAGGVVIGHLTTSVGMLAYAYRHFDLPARVTLSSIVSAHMPTVYCGVLVFLLERWGPVPAVGSVLEELGALTVKLGVYLALAAPLVLYANRQYGLLALVRRWRPFLARGGVRP